MKNDKVKDFLLGIALPIVTGALAALLTKDDMKAFMALKQPPLSPPQWLFPVVWTILYTLMGIASTQVYRGGLHRPAVKKSLFLYLWQLFFNFAWTIIFFHFDVYDFAFVWLVVLWCLILATTICFSKIDKRAGWLMLPYLLWVSFAGYLNLGVAILN